MTMPENQTSKKSIWKKILFILVVLILGLIVLRFAPSPILDAISKRQLDFLAVDSAWGSGDSHTIVWANGWTIHEERFGYSIHRLSKTELSSLDQVAAKVAAKLTANCNVDSNIEAVGSCIDCPNITVNYSSLNYHFQANSWGDTCHQTQRDLEKILLIAHRVQ